jgi:hypothetical protein
MDLREADLILKKKDDDVKRIPPKKKKSRPNLKNCSAKEEEIQQLLTGAKRPGGEADHSLPSRAKPMNAWSYTSIPL